MYHSVLITKAASVRKKIKKKWSDDLETQSQSQEPCDPFINPGHGIKTKIYDYCQSKDGDDQCIWLCQQRGRVMFAQDGGPSFDGEKGVLCFYSPKIGGPKRGIADQVASSLI